MRHGIKAAVVFGAAVALSALSHGRAAQASRTAKPQVTPEGIKEAIENKARSVQLVTFPDTAWNSVKVVRGGSPAKGRTVSEHPKAEIAEIVTFTDAQAKPVRIIRGETDRAVVKAPARSQDVMDVQLVTFANPQERPVSVLRGSFPHSTNTELFGPASSADLDRVAFAVDGAESSHGTDPRMWRLDPATAQGPMQVTAAAATDVGGGDRFDITENRALGRAYLARMYRRYGNWPDAVAAYNWGPGNVDSWIGGGRGANDLPLEVEHYRNHVLRDAALPGGPTSEALAR